MLLDYGQPFGSIVQYAYVVENVEQAILQYIEVLGIGPWHVIGPFVPPEGQYRSNPTDVEITLAIGFSGHVMIELIQQHNRSPSVFLEIVEKVGYGFHHFATVTRSFDLDLARHRQRGLQVAFSDRILGSRVAYLDTTTLLPGMVELVEWSPAIEAAQTAGFDAARRWDGQDPLRRMTAPPK